MTSHVDVSIATVEAITPDAMYFQVVPSTDRDWVDYEFDRIGGWRPSARAAAPLAALAIVATRGTMITSAPHVHSLPSRRPTSMQTGGRLAVDLRENSYGIPSLALLSSVVLPSVLPHGIAVRTGEGLAGDLREL